MVTTIDISKTKPSLSDLLIQVQEHGIQFLLMDGDKRVAQLSPPEPVEHTLWSEDDDDKDDGELWYPKNPERLRRAIDRALARELEPQTVNEFRHEMGLDDDE